MTQARMDDVELDEGELVSIVDALPIGDVLGKVDPLALARALGSVIRRGPTGTVVRQTAEELAKILAGRPAPDLRDPRFDDDVWRENPVFRRLLQSYLALTEAGLHLVDEADVAWRERTRARFAVEVISAILAPTNLPLSNPKVVRRAWETRGSSLARGARHLLSDLRHNHQLPSSVNRTPFVVGENLAATPGAVVHTDEMFQVLQYRPTTDTVHGIPLLIIPPEISRHYVVDLAPGRSLAEYTVSQAVPTFAVVWRNPTPEHGSWGLDDYVRAQLRAVEVVCEITGAEQVNILGVCGGGLSVAAMLGYQAAEGDARVRSATFVVTMVDSGQPSLIGAISNDRGQRQLREKADRGEILYGHELLSSFAWLRPNDLIFNYMINNWMLGNEPPVFDVLAWNADCTNATYAFVADASEALYGAKRLVQPGQLEVLGVPIDLGKVSCDSFHVAGATDHITTWRSCYMTSQALGGSSDVVVTSTGHVQSIISPPDKPRARFHAGPGTVDDPDAWLEQAQEHAGSWWPHWANWLVARSGDRVDAPATLGSADHPATEPAPGRYART